MKLKITSTTDGKFLGKEFVNEFPITLGDAQFFPDAPPISLGDKAWRFFNSNFSIDAKEA